MDALTSTLVYTTVAGAAIPLGGGLARIERIRPRWLEQEFRHGIIAFGGGVLLAAIALVLVPEGVRSLSIPSAALAMAGGGLLALLSDRAIQQSGASAAQLMAMLLDFLPEALALGAAFAAGQSIGPLLALLIALQNLPEGFNAYREMLAGKADPDRTFVLFLGLVPLGPAAGWIGLTFLAPHPEAVGAVMLVASGAILYLTFEDIAPQVPLRRYWAPPLGAVAGFLVGMVGHMATTGGE